MNTKQAFSANSYVMDDPPGKALIKLAGPMLVGMMAMTVFNLVDTWYVSKLGTLELAAISFTFPVVMLLNGVTLGIGIGLTAVISNKVGEGKQDEVRGLSRDGLILALIIVIVFMSAGLLTIEPLFRALGADEKTLPLVASYMRIWYFGSAAVVFPMVGNGTLRGTGDTATPAWIMSIAAVINMIMDPLLIFGIGPFPHMGLQGAAIATIFARGVAMVTTLYILTVRKRLVAVSTPNPRKMVNQWRQIMIVGSVAALIHILFPVSSGILTRIIASFGTEAVAAFGAGTRVEMFAIMIPNAMASGMMVYVGQHWGRKSRNV